MIEFFKEKICTYFHGGGRIKRDDFGRINWQCDKCGRWGDPVPLKDESRQIDADIETAISVRSKHDRRT